MVIRVNGQEREVREEMTLEALLESLGIKMEGMAVDVNKEVVPKGRFSGTILRPGDSIEIIRMVGGG